MSVNKFGLSENVTNTKVSKKYVDSQYITLTKQLEKKINKSGGTLSGELNMADNKITSNFEPDTPDTLVNKLFVDTNLNKISDKKLDVTGGKMTGSLDMSNNRVTNVGDPVEDRDAVNRGYCHYFVSYAGNLLKTDIMSQVETSRGTLDMVGVNHPDSALDAISKKYLQIAYLNNYENVKTKKLMSICRYVNDLLSTYSSTFDRQFRLKYTWMQNLILKYNTLYEKPELHPVVESILFSRVKDIICLLIVIIEELPQNIFIELKGYLVRNKISVTPEDHTDLMKIRRFIQRFANDVDPKRENESFELLLQKNLMFVDLGFHHVSDSLLAQFVI